MQDLQPTDDRFDSIDHVALGFHLLEEVVNQRFCYDEILTKLSQRLVRQLLAFTAVLRDATKAMTLAFQFDRHLLAVAFAQVLGTENRTFLPRANDVIELDVECIKLLAHLSTHFGAFLRELRLGQPLTLVSLWRDLREYVIC